MKTILKVQNLSFAYQENNVLENINFSIGENEFVGLIGPNGAGKSTLLKLLMGLLKLQQGTINIQGLPPIQAAPYIGYVPQHSQIDMNFPITVLEVVLMGLLSNRRLFQFWNTKDKEIAMTSLKKVGMDTLAHRQIHELSGGQRQRVFLARALTPESKILILDEPLTSIDTPMSQEFYEILTQINQEKAILLVSHDIGVFPAFVQKILCINKHIYCHDSKEEALKNLHEVYDCPFELISHGVPHRVLKDHPHD